MKKVKDKISKKSRNDQCSNFQTLSLISNAFKLLTIIISKRIEREIEEYLHNLANTVGIEAIPSLIVVLEKQIDGQKKNLMFIYD